MDAEARDKLETTIVKLRIRQAIFREASKPIRDQLSAQLKPFDDSIDALQETIDEVLEAHGVEIVGSCEGCDCIIFTGDEGHITEDGEYLCADHSPTWGDIKKQWDEGREEQFDGDRAAFMAAYEGRNPNDKATTICGR